jgi:lysophospholipase L1-like esterase
MAQNQKERTTMKRTSESGAWHCVGTRLLAGFLAAFIWQAPQAAQAADLGTIMPMGDSITLGVPVNGGYRDPLYTLLTNRADTFTFVGSLTDYATTALTAAGQAHHEGHSGYVITNSTLRTGLDENLASWIGGAVSPTNILLMIGSNDINLGYNMTNAPARLSDLITHICSYRPSVKLYVASIIPMVGHEPDVQAFNATIPGIVASHRALGRNVVYVPMYEALNINTDLVDGLHPNALGYLHMAQAWDTALHASTNLAVALTSPANNQAFTTGSSISATATVANAAGAYAVHVYTNSGSGAFAEAGVGGSSSPYSVSLGALPAGTYHIYATVTDTLATTNSATNTFTVATAPQTGVHAVDVTGAGSGPGLGSNFSVGWDFTVSQTIKVTSLGQFDPDSNPKSNSVAIYQRGGAKLIEAAVSAASPAEQSGIYSARYASVSGTVLTPGNYVVFSTQNGDNFIASDGYPTATFGSAIVWNKGVAHTNGSAAGPLLATAPANWNIENTNTYRYFGPTFKYDVVVPAPTLALTCPLNNQVITVGDSITATATVASAAGDYTVHVYTNSGSSAFSEAGTGGSSSPYTVILGTLTAGTYHIYATATDTNATATTATNTFTVAAKTGQQILSLTGWNQDIIVGKTEAAPGYSVSVGGTWDFYEYGLAGGTQGLAADSVGTNRTFTSSKNPSVRFQFAPYTTNNAVYLDGPSSATLTLVNPAKFQSLQFLEMARTMTWYARLNFSDGSSATTTTWSDPDWVANPGPADRCLTSYGLKGTAGGFYAGYLWMAERGYTLQVADQAKTLNSVTFFTTGLSGQQLAVFAVSGYVLGTVSGGNHAVDVLTAGDGPNGGGAYSVGWDFTVSQPIKVTSLGQFDPDSNPKANAVAIYQRAGAKLIEMTVSAASPAEFSGNYLARYAVVDSLVLTQGNYVVFSTQNGDNFIAGGGSPAATFGPGITWNKCVALGAGSSAGPLPATAPATWPLEGTSAWRYFGPTFKYDLVVPPPTLTIASPTNNQVLAVSDANSATATVVNAFGAYAVHVYMNSGSGAFAEVDSGGSASPYAVSLGTLPAGTYHIYASVTDTLASVTTATNTFTVAVKTGQQILSLTGWNQDLIIGKTETAPGYSTTFVGWTFYETGLSGGTQGLASDSGGTNRTFTSSSNPGVKFQFSPYAGSNTVYLSGPGSATLTLVNPARFMTLQFLETTRTMTWYATLNFSNGTSTTTSTWSDPDWTANGPVDKCLSSYGLKNSVGFYSGSLWMAGRAFTLPVADQAKTLTSITFTTTGVGDKQLAVFAVSGYALAATQEFFHAVDVTSTSAVSGGSTYSVGWDFTVPQTITVTSLGQFDPDANPRTNTVALYQRGGAKLAEAIVSAASATERSGNYLARYVTIRSLVLPPGDYVVFSTQNGDNFITSAAATLGPAITWNKGLALSSGSSAGPLPATAPASWPIEDPSAWRYFGPTFSYKLGGVAAPKGLLIRLR